MTPFYFKAGRTGCVLIHGFTGTPFTLLELGRVLFAQGMTVHAPLLPGHGTRPRDLIGISYHDWLDTCISIIDQMKQSCDHVIVIGLSMGGTIALHLASEIFMDGCVSLSAPIEKDHFLKPGFSIWKRIIPFWPKWCSLKKPYNQKLGYRWYPLPAVDSFLTLLSETRIRLPDVRCPVLLMHSIHDPRVPFSQMDILYHEIGSKIKEKLVLHDQKHTITLGQEKDKVFKTIVRFINKRCLAGLTEHGFQTAPGSFDSGAA